MFAYCLILLCLSQLALYTLLLIICNCRIVMVSYRWNKSFTHCSTLISFHCLISRIDFSLVIAYLSSYCLISVVCLILAFITLSRLLLPHFACYRLVLAIILAFICLILMFSQRILYLLWESMALMPLFDRGIQFSINALRAEIWYSHYQHWL